MNQYQLFSFSEINFALMRNDPARFFSSNIILRRILTVLLSHPSFRLPILKIITSFLLLDRFPLASVRDCSIISFILSGEILLYRQGTSRFQIYPEKYACRVWNDFSKMFIFSQGWTKHRIISNSSCDQLVISFFLICCFCKVNLVGCIIAS